MHTHLITGNPSCTSSCNTQLTDSQYQLCCDTKNYGKFLHVTNENDDTLSFMSTQSTRLVLIFLKQKA